MIRQHAIGPTRTTAILMIGASVLLAAIGYGVLSVQVVRDPQNPVFVGNTIGSSDTTTSTQVVRDPSNPAYAGNTIGSETTPGAQVVRDPANPYWTGATLIETSAADQAAIRGATQGLR
jgi:hypothetical protein